MSIIGVCGYRGHGKDTLCRTLKNMVSFKNPQFETHIFHGPRRDNLMCRLLRRPRIVRFASADTIKHQMCRTYGMSYSELDMRKDDRITNSDLTHRDVMISVANRFLSIDKFCFIKRIEQCEIDDQTTVVVTDLRMSHEHEYLQKFSTEKGLEYVTIRVFRPDVLIPPINDPTEHGLDHLVTDYFVGPTADSINSFNSYLNIDDYFSRGQGCSGGDSGWYQS